MKSSEQLREEYEEARFALLMEELARLDGEELLRLNEKLKEGPAIPEEADRRCEQAVQAAFAQRRVRAAGRRSVRRLTKVLFAAVLALLMFAAAFALNEDVRVSVLNAVLTVEDAYTQITFQETGEGGSWTPARTSGEDGLEYRYGIALEWTPEGYDLDPEACYVNSLMGCCLSLLSPVDGEIFVSVTPYDASTVYNINSEGSVRKEAAVQGFAAALYTTEEDVLKDRFSHVPGIWSERQVLWLDQENRRIIHVYATNLTEEEALRLAEGVRWREP